MSDTSAPDTFDRSCAHWSADGRAGMDAFYRLATEDYRLLVTSRDWVALFEALAGSVGTSPRSLRVADVACGSGKFPAALLRHTRLAERRHLRIEVDLLDPSGYSLATARAALAPPFVAAAAHQARVQDWSPAASYDLIWAMHALYCVPASELEAAASVLRRALARTGVGVVAQGRREGHYVGFYDRFIETFRAGAGTPYSDASQVAAALRSAGLAVTERTLRYETILDARDRALAERYLQRCVFDESVSLEAMRSTGTVAEYLRDSLDEGARVYRFAQPVGLVFWAHDEDVLSRALVGGEAP